MSLLDSSNTLTALPASDAGQSGGDDLLILAAVLEFLAALDQNDGLDSAADRAAALLCQALPARRVIFLWRNKQEVNLKVIADSESVGASSDRHQLRCLIAAGEEVAARGSLSLWPIPERPNRRHALLAVAQLANLLQAKQLVGVDLVSRDGRSQGAMLVIDHHDSSATRFLSTAADPLTSKLVALERLQPTPLESAWRSITESFANRYRIAIVIGGLMILAMLIPVHYRVSAELELRPVGRRFVAVPFDGPLKSASVRPGDTVQTGDVIATIDPREIDYELAGVRMAWNQAQQEKKGRMAAHEVAATKMADLESERLRLQRDLLVYRRDNLQIRSPIDGVIISGDWKESEGMPMTLGEVLFEIAPVGRMIVEVEVDESDIAHVRVGMTVDFHVDAFPNRQLTGSVARIHPRAQQRNQNNVFVTELQVDDRDGVLRPGMRGHATITSDKHPLGWNLFHKAFDSLRRLVGR